MIILNHDGEEYAKSLIHYDAVDMKSPWTFSADDEEELLGDDGDNWTKFGNCHLGLDGDADAQTKARFAYPFAKQKGEVVILYRSALEAIRQRSAQQGETAIYDVAGLLLDSINKNKESTSMDDTKTVQMQATGTVTVEAAPKEGYDGDEKKVPLPKFRMVANTGQPMALAGWKYPVVMDLEGMNIPSQQRPIRFGHDAMHGVGHTTSIGMENGNLVASGVISRDTPAAREVIASAKNAFPWQASIGASVQESEHVREGQKTSVNGKEFEGPLIVARKSSLGEISFVDLGADEHTSVQVAAEAKSDGVVNGNKEVDDDAGVSASIARVKAERLRKQGIAAVVSEHLEFRGVDIAEVEKIAAECIENGSTVRDAELLILRATRPRAPAVLRGADAPTPKVLEAALCLAMGMNDDKLAKDRDYGPEVMTQAWPRRNMGLQGTIAAALEASGMRVPHGKLQLFDAVLEQRNIRAEGFSTVNLPGILGNVANKILLDAFTLMEATYDKIADQADFSNFHVHSIYRLESLGDFALVPHDGELKHGNLGQDSYTNQLATRGQILTLTRQDIINDDLNAFRSLPTQLAKKARIAAEKALYTALMEASDVFYTTARGNRLTGAIGVTELGAAEAALLSMVDLNGDPIYATPRYLVVPPALKFFAEQIFTSTLVNDFTTGKARPTDNPFKGRFEVITSPFLSTAALAGSSASTWYLLANPMLLPAFQIAYLDGRRAPVIETADAVFSTLGLQMRCYWDFGLGQIDYRGAIKSTAS
jgi:hypothetical protein